MTFKELEKLRDLVDAAADGLAAELDAVIGSSREQWGALEEMRAAARCLHGAFASLYLHEQRYGRRQTVIEEEVPGDE